MLKYIVKRILMLIPVLLGATFIVFTVMDMTPGGFQARRGCNGGTD